ncbi:hypothetical protein BJ170DRAFT_567059, partial [Xylariales sp. AK1849]
KPAHIYLASRSKQRGEAAIKHVMESVPNATPVSFLSFDLSSFASIKAADKTLKSAESRLYIHVNNVAIMMTPEGLTVEGNGIQSATDYMGHVLFTQRILPMLRETAKSNP